LITFTKVKLPYGWLGNMSPYPVEHQGVSWRTSEALFQAMRFVDQGIREKIRAEKSPMGAKMVAKSNSAKMVIVPRSRADVLNMVTCLRLKVDQNALWPLLLDTGDETLVEDVTSRPNEGGLFWGMAKRPDETWHGQNWLGKIWMKLRETGK
jgi:ribA/ribD-fused uncharacterized protein